MVIDLAAYRKKKDGTKEREWLEKKLDMSSPEEFNTRMQRIHASLERINQVMWELKQNSHQYTHGGKE